MNETFKLNNFDIVRLIAASQVAGVHILNHLEVATNNNFIFKLLAYFPGVPIFFFVSGFLISKSYEKNSILLEYVQNRLLRIYPALIACTLIAILSVFATGYFAGRSINPIEFCLWLLGQITFLQFYNPEFMREFGTGVLNGSLWTITVELQFYIVLPIIYWLFKLNKTQDNNSLRNTNLKLLALIAFFMVFHIARHHLVDIHGERILFKLWSVTFSPWIYMFLIGVLFQTNFAFFHRLLSGKALLALTIYLASAYFLSTRFDFSMGNGINPLLYLLLAASMFSFAYSLPDLSSQILNGNDISYGVYIYHAPVINLFMYYGYVADSFYALSAIGLTFIIAILSWFIVEKNSMKLKKHPLNPLNSTKKN